MRKPLFVTWFTKIPGAYQDKVQDQETSMPAPKLFRLSPTVVAILASGALLSGCDLWGSGDSSASDNNATVSEVDTPVAAGAQMEEAGSANGGYLFTKTNVNTVVHEVDENGDPVDRVVVGQLLHVIDPSTGQEVGSGPIQVDADSTQVVAKSFTMSADGLSQQANGINDTLFFTDAHTLYKVSLARREVTEMQQQVSSETHICQLVKAIPKDANATGSWIVLTATRTADGDCAQADDVVTKVVDSEATDSMAATSTGQLDQVLTAQRDAQGKLLGVLGLAPAETTSTTNGSETINKVTRKLVTMNGDTGSVTEVNLGLDASLHAAYFDRVAGSTTKAYLRVTDDSNVNALYVLDWSTGTPSLSRNAVGNLTAFQPVFVHADTAANYYVDGLTLASLKPGASPTTLATLSKGAPQPGGVMTASYLVVPQQDGDGNLHLQAFSKTAPNRVIDIMPTVGGALRIEAHNGDVLIVSQAMDATSGQTTLWRVDLNVSGEGSALAAQVTLISATQAASESLTGEQQQAYLIWSQPLNSASLRVSSYQLSSQQTLSLGTNATWDLAQATALSITQGLLTATTGTTDALFSFDTAKAGSLAPVNAAQPN
jgi:hypothetical protein